MIMMKTDEDDDTGCYCTFIMRRLNEAVHVINRIIFSAENVEFASSKSKYLQ